MSFFEFCLEIIKREGKKFNVGVNTAIASQITAATASDVNFDIAHNRCSFLYRCGAINLSFARECFTKFLLDEKSKFLLSKWDNCSNLTVCSISKGPALDYIALLLSYQECNILPPKFKSIKVLSKYGAWRNTANIMLEILNEGYLTCSPSIYIGDIEVIQGDPFVEFTEKVKHPISDSDIVLMVKTLNLQADGYDKVKIAKLLQEFLETLKPGAIIFCIDTKPSIGLITHQLCSFVGNFLCEPTYMNSSMTNLEHTEFYKDIFGCFPVASARGSFFVWQKVHNSQKLESLLDEVKESFKNTLTLNNSQDNVSCNKLCEDSFSKLSENSYSKQQVMSTSTILCENTFCDLTSNKDSKLVKSNNSEQSFGNGNIDENSKYFVLESLLQNNLPAYEYRKEDNKLCKKPSKSSILVNQAVQTEPEYLKETDSIKMNEINNKIAKLTTTLSEMLQMSELDGCKIDNCLKDTETECKHTLLNDCIHNHHSTVACCIHGCLCNKNSQSLYNCHTSCKCQKKVFENCCQNHINHQQEQFTPNQCSSSASFSDDFEASKNDSLCHNRLKFSTENNSVSTPKLVIPLNTLSGSAISQIISIIAQSNQEQ